MTIFSLKESWAHHCLAINSEYSLTVEMNSKFSMTLRSLIIYKTRRHSHLEIRKLTLFLRGYCMRILGSFEPDIYIALLLGKEGGNTWKLIFYWCCGEAFPKYGKLRSYHLHVVNLERQNLFGYWIPNYYIKRHRWKKMVSEFGVCPAGFR